MYYLILFLFVISFLMLLSGINGPIQRRKAMENKYGVEVAHYMVDYGLSVRKARKRIEMETVERVRRRERERGGFTAVVDCPRCGVWGVHWIKGGRIGRLTRQCRECDWEWIQT